MSNHGDFPSPPGVPQPPAAANDDINEQARPRSPAEVLEPARAPEPPSGRRRRRNHPILMLLNGAMSVLVMGLLAVGALFYIAKIQFDKPGPLGHSTVFVIPKGEGDREIAERLEREGIISDRLISYSPAFSFC